MSFLTFDPHSERIALAHKRLADAYARKPGAEVPVIEPGARGPVPGFASTDGLADFDKMLVNAAAWANGLAAGDNDWPPFVDTFCGVVMIPEAFGCEVVYGSDVAWTKPALAEISGVWKLKPKPLDQSPMIRRLTEWVDLAQRKLGAELPMWTMDIQSPFSVAARVVEPNELLIACITDPKAVHHLCRMVTDYSIEMTAQHIRQMEHPGFPGRNFPSISENIGVCIADDTPLIMLSPAMYREFSLPYNSRIGEAFGGVHVHSCGDYRHNMDNLLDITNIRSVQAHVGPGEFPLPGVPDEDCAINRARKRVTHLIDTNGVARADRFFNKPREHYAEYVLPWLLSGDLAGCILQSCGTGGGVPDADAALRWTREQLKKKNKR